MGRQKKVSKPKEPVRIRQRKLKNGNISLYLDIYSDGVRKYESCRSTSFQRKTRFQKTRTGTLCKWQTR